MGEGIELEGIALHWPKFRVEVTSDFGPVGRYPTQTAPADPNETKATDRYLPYIIDMMTGY